MFFYTPLNIPETIVGLGTDGLETHGILKDVFIQKYNSIVPKELIFKLLSTLFARSFGDLAIFTLSSENSTDSNQAYDGFLLKLANSGIINLNGEGSRIKVGSFGKYPFVAFYREINQIEPDFVAFNKQYVPEDLRRLV